MFISDPSSELADYYGYAKRLRALAAEHIEGSERNRLQVMAARIEEDAKTFALKHRIDCLTEGSVACGSASIADTLDSLREIHV